MVAKERDSEKQTESEVEKRTWERWQSNGGSECSSVSEGSRVVFKDGEEWLFILEVTSLRYLELTQKSTWRNMRDQIYFSCVAKLMMIWAVYTGS